MAANRYTNPQWNQPISMFVPRPFQQAMMVGEATQRKHDKGLQDLADTASMIHINADPKHYQHRDELLNNYNNQINDLADSFVKTGPTPENQMKLTKLKKQFANDPNRLQLESNYNNYQKYQKDVEDLYKKGEYDPINSEYDPYKYLQTNSSKVTPFNYTGSKGVLDYYEPASKMMSGIKPSGSTKDAYNIDENGNIISVKKGYEAVARQDVNRVAQAKTEEFLSHKNSKYFIDKYLSHNPNANTQDLYNAAYDYLRKEGENQIFSKTNQGTDFQYAPKYIHDENILPKTLIGQTLEGQTYNAIDNDSQFNKLLNDNILTKDKNGLVKVNWSNLGDTKEKTYTKYDYDKGSRYVQTGEKLSGGEQKQRDLFEQMKKMANVVGFEGELSSKNYDLIASAYNTLSKARLYGEQLAAPVRNLESEKTTANWHLNTFYNPKDINTLSEAPELKQGDKIVVTDRQTNSNGEMIKKGVIIGKDNSRTPFAIKPNSIEDGGFFDSISKVGIKSAKYQVGQLPKSDVTTADGKSVVDSQVIPGIGSVHTIENNPKNKSDISYVFTSKDGNTVKFDNYSDLQRELEMLYYTRTREGISDVQELLNKKQDKQSGSFEE